MSSLRPAALDLLRVCSRESVAMREIARALPSRDDRTIERERRQLVSEGLLRVVGAGRETRYVATEEGLWRVAEHDNHPRCTPGAPPVSIPEVDPRCTPGAPTVDTDGAPTVQPRHSLGGRGASLSELSQGQGKEEERKAFPFLPPEDPARATPGVLELAAMLGRLDPRELALARDLFLAAVGVARRSSDAPSPAATSNRRTSSPGPRFSGETRALRARPRHPRWAADEPGAPELLEAVRAILERERLPGTKPIEAQLDDVRTRERDYVARCVGHVWLMDARGKAPGPGIFWDALAERIQLDEGAVANLAEVKATVSRITAPERASGLPSPEVLASIRRANEEVLERSRAAALAERDLLLQAGRTA